MKGLPIKLNLLQCRRKTMEFKFTINTDNLNDPDSIEEAVADFKLLIRFLQRANPNYYLLGNLLDEQLEQQLEQIKSEDPKQQMIAKWDELWVKYNGEDFTQHCLADNVRRKVDNFYSQIGEAMGPVCYAAWQVCSVSNDRDVHAWINDCVKYYEEHWEM